MESALVGCWDSTSKFGSTGRGLVADTMSTGDIPLGDGLPVATAINLLFFFDVVSAVATAASSHKSYVGFPDLGVIPFIRLA